MCVNRRFTIADTPGYGSIKASLKNDSGAAVRQEWEEKFKPLVEEYLETTPWLRAAIYVHEISKDVTDGDREMVEMLRQRSIPVLLVLTKDDKVDSDTHRCSRATYIRRGLKWPKAWPHAYYTTRYGGYGQLFKNMLGTMLLGLVATETREDARHVLLHEIPEIFWDYRDKYVPRKRSIFGKIPPEKKIRLYPNEDKPFTDEDLEKDERWQERKEKKAILDEEKEAGYKRTRREDIEAEVGGALTPRERRRRWEDLLQDAER